VGTWGSGNVENDGAGDYAGGIIGQLEATIEDCLADEDRAALDEDGEAIPMPSVDLIAVICEHCREASPAVDVVQRWRDSYLRIFDEQVDGLDPAPKFKQERRQVIVDTFARLEQYAQWFWGDDAPAQ
jgi:hypothetical protein